MKRFEDTLEDIADALQLGYVSTHPNLITRKITALKLLGRETEADQAYQSALQLHLDCEWKEKLRAAYEVQVPLCLDIKLTYKCCKEVVGKNDKLDSASEFVRMTYDAYAGRGLSVTRDVAKGEVLIVCQPLAAVLANKFGLTYCDHCMKALNDRYLTCGQCCNVRYCSARCRGDSFASYHRLECKFWPALRLYPNGLHALRILLVCGFQSCFDYSVTGSEHKPTLDEWPKLGFSSTFACFSSLFRKEMSSLEFTYSYPMASALYALIALRMALTSSDNVQKLASVTIMDTLLIISRNADTVFNASWSDIIGSSVHCPSALFNHSCEPNVDTFYVGSKVVHLAKRDLRLDEPIFVSYGVNFAEDPIHERREFLKNSYSFECYCDRCRRELKGEMSCLKCGTDLDKTIFKTLACRKCDVDEEGEFLTEECFDLTTDYNYYCNLM